MQDSAISNILKSPIGPTLCKGFAALYRTQPQFPVTYLASWLLQESKNQSARVDISQQQKIKSSKSKELQEIHDERERVRANRKVEPELDQKLEVLKTLMGEYEFKEDLLEEILPEFIKEKEGVAASYIAELRFPMKRVGEEEGEETWVEDSEAPKVLKYVGASNSNKQLMIGKILEQQKGGVSWDVVLKEEEEEPLPQQNENGEPIADSKPVKKLQKIYIPNVLKEPKMHYFRLPKLGSYLGFKWMIESYLVEEAFDKGGEKQKQYHQQIQNLKRQHQEAISDLKAELQEKESKENYQQDEAYIEMREKLESLEAKQLILPQLKFPSLTKVFLVAADTLGDDTEISKEKQDNIENILRFFKQKWEESERESLVRDLEIYSNYQVNVDIETEKLQQDLENEGNSYTEKVGERVVGEKDLKYEVEEVKMGLLRKVLLEKGREYLRVYSSYNIGKYLDLLQDLLVFGGISIPYDNEVGGERKLRWRKARVLVNQLSESILSKVETISNKIEEQEEESLNKLLLKFDKYDFDTIGGYNMGLWLLAQLVRKHVELTLLASEIFTEKKEAFLRDRESKIEEKERILEEREKAFEEHVAGLDEEEKEKFNEGDWYVNYDTEHPVPIIEDIPPEYADPKAEEEEVVEQQKVEEEREEGEEQEKRDEKQGDGEQEAPAEVLDKPASSQSNRQKPQQNQNVESPPQAAQEITQNPVQPPADTPVQASTDAPTQAPAQAPAEQAQNTDPEDSLF